MIRSGIIEYSDAILDEVTMFALEAQFRQSAMCLNQAEYLLHKRTEIALGAYYKRISDRARFLRYGNFLSQLESEIA